MRLVIPGGAGFIGANLLDYIFNDQKLSQLFKEIVVVDPLQYVDQKIESQILGHKKVSFLKASIYDDNTADEVIKKNDVIVHLATEENTFENPQGDLSFDFGTYLRDTSKKQIRKFIFLSTADIYGINNSDNLLESEIIRPTTIYSANKVAFEAFIQAYFYLYNFPAVIFRPVTIYGPKQHPGWLVPRVINRVLQDKTIQITGDGLVKRDWIFVDDVCNVVIKALLSEKKEIFGEVFNLGTGKESSVMEVTKYILEKLDKPTSLIEFVESRSGEIPRQVTFAKKARGTFKWKPEIDFFDGLDKTIEWYENKMKN